MEQENISEEPKPETSCPVLEHYTRSTIAIETERQSAKETLKSVNDSIMDLQELVEEKSETVLGLLESNAKISENIEHIIQLETDLNRLRKRTEDIVVDSCINYNQIKNIGRAGKEHGDQFQSLYVQMGQTIYKHKALRKEPLKKLVTRVEYLKDTYSKNKEEYIKKLNIYLTNYESNENGILQKENEIQDQGKILEERDCGRLAKIEDIQRVIDEKDVLHNNFTKFQEALDIAAEKYEKENQYLRDAFSNLQSEIRILEKSIILEKSESEIKKNAYENQEKFMNEISANNEDSEKAIEDYKTKFETLRLLINETQNEDKFKINEYQSQLINISSEIKQLEDGLNNWCKEKNLMQQESADNEKKINKLQKEQIEQATCAGTIENSLQEQELLQKSSENLYEEKLQENVSKLQDIEKNKKYLMELEKEKHEEFNNINNDVNIFEEEFANLQNKTNIQEAEITTSTANSEDRTRFLEQKCQEAKKNVDDLISQKQEELTKDIEKANVKQIKAKKDVDKQKRDIDLTVNNVREKHMQELLHQEEDLLKVETEILTLAAGKKIADIELDSLITQINQKIRDEKNESKMKSSNNPVDILGGNNGIDKSPAKSVNSGSLSFPNSSVDYGRVFNNRKRVNIFSSTLLDPDSDDQQKRDRKDDFDTIRQEPPQCETPLIRFKATRGKRRLL